MIRRCADGLSAAQACAAEIAGLVASLPRAAIAVSGGSSPMLMFDELARLSLDWRSVHLFWVDERGVPPDHPQSNYRMTEAHLLKPARIPAANVHRILAELEPHEAARRYASEISDFFGTTEPAFDLVHMGVGQDSHTASLFPGDPLISDRSGIAAATYVDKSSQWRITLLPKVLLAAKNCFVLAPGAEKREVLRAILEGPVDPLNHPAQIVTRLREFVCFLDRAADPFEQE